MQHGDRIASEPGKRGGRPCLRGTGIAVADVLGWLAAGMSHDEITADFPEVGEDEIRACLAYPAAAGGVSSLSRTAMANLVQLEGKSSCRSPASR